MLVSTCANNCTNNYKSKFLETKGSDGEGKLKHLVRKKTHQFRSRLRVLAAMADNLEFDS